MDAMNNTLEYYNQNSEAFYSGTVNADMSELYAHFEPLLPAGASILDLGCGSGRDSLHFIKAGYSVTAVDGSKELCTLAEKLLEQPVRCMLYEEWDYTDTFDGVWACSSLLHVPKSELPKTIRRISDALKPSGILYASFKYGDSEREAGGRLFSDYTENGIAELTSLAPELELIEFIITNDVRSGRSNEKWLNIIWRKTTDDGGWKWFI